MCLKTVMSYKKIPGPTHYTEDVFFSKPFNQIYFSTPTHTLNTLVLESELIIDLFYSLL